MASGEKTRRESVHKADMDAKPQTEKRNPDQSLRTAFDVKEVHRTLRDEFTDDELRGIPIISEGQRLQQGGIYIDLNDPDRREFTATGDMSAGPRNVYTSKSEVPYPLWNRLMGVEHEERTANRRRATGD